MAARAADPATAYARDVVDGRVVTGRLVRLACQRHLDDLAHAKERGLRWDEEEANAMVRFFRGLSHSKGRWAGRPVVLEPWQAFALGCPFAWKRDDGTRRFRTAYHEMARKNGKSTMASGVGLKLAFFDGEPGAEVYTAATKRDQARIVHGEAVRMVKASPHLRRRVRIFKDNLSSEATNSKYLPLGADADTLDGLNPHGVIIDELHAHKTRKVWDVLDTATGARLQPLLYAITTAGYDRHSVCREQHDYAERVLTGQVRDDSFFAYIAALDDGDDWQDERCWVKANPNLGVSVHLEELREKFAKAKASPASQNAFRRLRLDEWTEQAERWLDLEVWDGGGAPLDPESLAGRECYGGLDLARVRDLSALALLFPPQLDAEPWKLLVWFWCPEQDIRRRSDEDRVPYDVWAREGLLLTTPGRTTDHRFIMRTVLDVAARYDVREVAYDRLFTEGLFLPLHDEGLTVTAFGQGFMSMATPTAEFQRLLLAGGLNHGGHPVLRWMAANVVVRQDPAGNLKPDKERSPEKIDGIVAAIMALGVAMSARDQGLPIVVV